MSEELDIPTFADVLAAAERIRPYVKHTPILTSTSIDDYCGRPVFMKAEHLQTTGAYKIRGGTNFIRAHIEAGLIPPGGVIAASSGNHGLGVARAAQSAGVRATIVLPTDVVTVKRDAIEAYGARIVLTAPDQTQPTAAALADQSGLLNIPPYDHPLIVAGQATATLEALNDAPPVRYVLAPIGGGALAAGAVLAAHDHPMTPHVIGVEPSVADDTRQSLAAGRRITIPAPSSVADGLLPPTPGVMPFTILSGGLHAVLTVTDDQIMAATRYIAQRTKQLIEPSAAVTIAALATNELEEKGPVLVILSGGNMDLALL